MSSLALYYALGVWFGFYLLGFAQNLKRTWHCREVSMGLVVPSALVHSGSLPISAERPPVGRNHGHLRAYPGPRSHGQASSSHHLSSRYFQPGVRVLPALSRHVGRCRRKSSGFGVEELESLGGSSPSHFPRTSVSPSVKWASPFRVT